MKDYEKSVVIATINGTTFRWKVSTIWAFAEENKSVETASVSDFDFELDHDRWFQNHHKPTLRKIIDHCRRINEADLSWPIIVDPDGRILDGTHRLAKAIIMGLEKVSVIRLKQFPPSDF